MMEHNWENFLKNLGEWQGSFTQVSATGELGESTPSLLTLRGENNNQIVHFRLQRFGPEGEAGPPISDHAQTYQTLGRQAVFFETGAFSKGSLQFAPYAEFGAEYGFVADDRRLRFVQLYDRQGQCSGQVLIREFRRGTAAVERPPLTVAQLLGEWQGVATTAYADWQPTETSTTRLVIEQIADNQLRQQLTVGDRHLTTTARIAGNQLQFDSDRRILLLPDGTSSHVPLQIQLRQAFFVEVGWLVTANERQRLIRNYNEKGEWVSATHVIEHRVTAG
ncbi:DUF3598 family protein [Trichothermofontia sp.]